MPGNDRNGALQQEEHIFMTEIIAFDRGAVQGEQREIWFS
jgi:hypothetical protein